MALPQYSLGPITFLGMNGNRLPPMAVVSLDERPGVDGTEITNEGIKGRPFTLRCWKDCASYNAAWQEFNEITTLIYGDPLELVFGDTSTFAEGYFVAVLGVRPVNITKIKPGTNGLNPPSAGWLEVDIDLIAIEG